MARLVEFGRGAAIASCAAALCAAPTAARAQEANPVVLDGADSASLDAIRLTLPPRDPPTTIFDAERLADEAAARAETWMRSEGYYAGRAIALGEETPLRARVTISLGRRFSFAAPKLEFTDGAPPPDIAAAADAALPRAEAPARAADVLAAETALLGAVQGRGYAQAKLETREAIVDHATGTMSVTYRIALGAPSRLGVVQVEPGGIVKDSFVRKLAPWSAGEVYAPEKLSTLRTNLTSTGAFSRVSVDLAPANAEGLSDVVVKLEQARKRTLELGASYSTSEGGGFDAQWTRRNITHRADALTLAASLAEKDQKLSASLWRPHEIRPGIDLRYSVEIHRENITAYDRIGVVLGVATEADLNARRALTYGVSVSADDYSGATAGVANAYVLSTFVNGRLDFTDNRFDPRQGSILEARVEPAISTGDATLGFVRLTSGARGYYSPTTAVTLAARVNGGWAQTVSGKADDLPLDRRFYAGGGGSVRGFAYKSIYPVNPLRAADDPPGGQGLLETSLEARFRIRGPFGAAAFVDGGSAFNGISDVDMRWGAGVGLRYDLGFAPVRLDVAVPLNRRPNDPDFSVYVSLGQAF